MSCKRAAGAGILLAALLTASPAPAETRDIVRGTDRDDVIFGDLGQFPGKGILGDGGLPASLRALDNRELIEIGRMLEGKNGIEGPDDTADVIHGGAGDDIIFAQGGNDAIDAGPGSDIVFAGSGNDCIMYDPADRFIDGGSGIDILVAGPGAPSLRSLKEKGTVANIEVLLVLDDMDPLEGVRGIRVEDDKVVLDATVWKAGGEGTGIYVSRDDPAVRLEVDPGVDIVWGL